MQIRVKANRMISSVVLLNVAAIEEKDEGCEVITITDEDLKGRK